MKVLVIGGAGFIGSEFVRQCVANRHKVKVLDTLTYATNYSADNIKDLIDNNKITFYHGLDDTDESCAEIFDVDIVVDFAAESHVDNSIHNALGFVDKNIGNLTVYLNCTVKYTKSKRFIYVSTDEVYGSNTGKPFSTSSPINPSNPYSASKAGAEAMVMAYGKTYGLKYIITRGANTFGPKQHPEKFIPNVCWRVLNNESIRLYGDGSNLRHWISVEYHASCILQVMKHLVDEGFIWGSLWNTICHIGSTVVLSNAALVTLIGANLGMPYQVRFVEDRLGHDTDYSIEIDKRFPEYDVSKFKEDFAKTIAWYKENPEWLNKRMKSCRS